MSTQLRELFNGAADSGVPYDLAERAMGRARRRRRNRLAVGGAVLATAAVVLGYVVAAGDVRLSSDPRPTDVATLPQVLPALEGLPRMAAGSVDAASVAYVVGGQVVFVDAETRKVAAQSFGPVPEGGGVESVLVSVTNVALSPDGRKAVVAVDGWPKGENSTVRVFDVASAEETVVAGVAAAGGPPLSVFTWSNDSTSFWCACSTPSSSEPKLLQVTVGGEAPEVQQPGFYQRFSPLQVTAGTAGVAVQSQGDDSWQLVDGSSEGGSAIPASVTAAMGRGESDTYLALQSDGYGVGRIGSDSFDVTGPDPGEEFPPTPPVTFKAAQFPRVEAAQDGFVLATIVGYTEDGTARMGRTTGGLLTFVGEDGAQQSLAQMPPDIRAASVAADLVGLPPEPTPEPDAVTKVPDALPAPDGLPSLTGGTMDAASAAYIVDGEVVVIDAATGEGALVDFAPSRELYGGVPLTIEQDASVALSPSGEYLMVSSGARTSDFPSEWNPDTEWMWLVDVGSGQVRLLQDLELATSPEESPVPGAQMAWSPDGRDFACICTSPVGGQRPTLHLVDMSEAGQELAPGEMGPFEDTGVIPTQISWGTGGLVAQLTDLDPEWRLVPVGDFSRTNPGTWPPLESVSMLAPGALRFSAVAMGHSDEGGFLAKLALRKGGSGELLVVPEDGEDRSVESVPSRPWLGALGDSYFVVLTDWNGDPYNEEVDRVDGDGETVLTTLPPGTTTVAFASDLIG